MKRSLLPLAALAAVAMTSMVHQARAAVIINDFQNTGFAFDYGSFTGNITTSATHISIVNATEQGGAGTNANFDLSSYYPSGQVSIEARLVSGNLANHFNIILATTAGTDYSLYQFSTAGLNTSTFTTVTVNLNAPLQSVGTMNWANITQYQLQGDYSTTDNFSLEFRNLEVVPEPATWVLLAGGLGVLAVLRRRKIG
ncbi:MAG: hypothetical protein Fur0032_10810 [Terrimicrobiaceae bacterium]